MPSYRPLHFIGERIEAGFDQPPALEKKPGCPDYYRWRGDTYRVVVALSEWHDYSRRGRMAHNMRPGHAAAAARRGSWGVGRDYFRVRAQGPLQGAAEPACGLAGGRIFELYYDRAPKGSDQPEGAWFLVSELVEVTKDE